MLTILTLGCGSALLLIPMMAIAQNDAAPSAASAEAARKFRAYLADDWKRWLIEYPEMATSVGYPGQDRRWTDDSPQAIEHRKAHLAESLATLKTIKRGSLPPRDQLNFDLYLDLLEVAHEGLQFGDDPMPLRNVVPRNL
ncbi:MAG TPA: DUF885 family protein, partial [Candidatus Acidoferrum sp.]